MHTIQPQLSSCPMVHHVITCEAVESETWLCDHYIFSSINQLNVRYSIKEQKVLYNDV